MMQLMVKIQDWWEPVATVDEADFLDKSAKYISQGTQVKWVKK